MKAAWPATGAVERRASTTPKATPPTTRRYLALDRAPRRRSWCSPPTRPSRRAPACTCSAPSKRRRRAPPPRCAVVDGRRLDLAAARPDALVVLGTRTLTRAGPGAAWPATWPAAAGCGCRSGPTSTCRRLSEVLGLPVRLAPDPVAASGDEAALVPADRRHPMLRRLDRVGVGAESPADRAVPPGARRAGLGGPGPLRRRRAWRWPSGASAKACWCSSPRTSTTAGTAFPLEPSFAPFVVETARYLTGGARSRSAFTLPDVPDGVPATPGPHQVAQRRRRRGW